MERVTTHLTSLIASYDCSSNYCNISLSVVGRVSPGLMHMCSTGSKFFNTLPSDGQSTIPWAETCSLPHNGQGAIKVSTGPYGYLIAKNFKSPSTWTAPLGSRSTVCPSFEIPSSSLRTSSVTSQSGGGGGRRFWSGLAAAANAFSRIEVMVLLLDLHRS